jgi:hypothetical protein
MDRFLIETSHEEQICLALIEVLDAQGYLTHFDWACDSGIHTGWAVIEADTIEEARLTVPPLVRKEARVVKVTKFDATTFARMHGHELILEGVSHAKGGSK